MNRPAWIESLFATIDARDAEGFARFLTEDGTFRFGNLEPVRGRDAVEGFVRGFFSTLAGLRHDVEQFWEVPGAVVVEGRVTYTRPNGTNLTVPFADVLRLDGDAIHDYRVYIDVSELRPAS